jgi:hypothetical protein
MYLLVDVSNSQVGLYYQYLERREKGTTMTDEKGKQQQRAQGEQDWYEVEIEGYFNPGWFDWLNGWAVTHLPNGNTLLSGWVRDQPALHGLFAQIRDLNIKIISLKKSSHPQPYEKQAMKKQD